MDKGQRRAQSSLVESKAFLDAHHDVLGVLDDAPARLALADAIQRIEMRMAAQASALLVQDVVRERSAQAAVALVKDHMKPIAAFARASLAGSPGFAALTNGAVARPRRPVIAAGRAMADAAAPLAGEFTVAKFPMDFVEQLAAAADELENAMFRGAANKADRIAATSGIATALKDGRDAIRKLDPVVTRLLKDSDVLAGWESVKRVRRA